MTRHYLINSFITYDLENELVLHSKYNIDKIFLDNEKKLLLRLQKKIGKIINENEISKYMNEFQVNETFLQYLIDKKVLSLSPSLQMGIKEIFFYSSKDYFNESIKTLFENNPKIHVLNSIEQVTKEVERNESDLFLIFFNEYNKKEASVLRDLFKKYSNTYSSLSYLYNDYLYIDSLYSDKWNLPCHLCHMNLIENEHRIGAEEQVTYQIMIDELFDLDNEFKIKHALSKPQQLNVLTQICNFINNLSQPCYQVSKSYSVFTTGTVYNIKEGTLSKGYSHHWELCDCYE
ncbi:MULTISPECIES: McbB family protein [unclassified Exiguobacterium]|uniref:McbB family protein n=1 Tax=unclassified Exiguobacterium TaxID=2644629 RepID=UPI001BEB2842|nr:MULTISPECIES: McbB family protein [unclassified Exiguobacterium]